MEKPKDSEAYNVALNTALQLFCKTFHCEKNEEP
jgi:hypothetical protein